MNKLPLEIENTIWNMYYMDIYRNIINEYNNISYLKKNIQINIDEIKKYFRVYRFFYNNINIRNGYNLNDLKILLLETNNMLKNIFIYHKCIVKYLFFFNIDKLLTLSNIYNKFPKIPKIVAHNIVSNNILLIGL